MINEEQIRAKNLQQRLHAVSLVNGSTNGRIIPSIPVTPESFEKDYVNKGYEVFDEGSIRLFQTNLNKAIDEGRTPKEELEKAQSDLDSLEKVDIVNESGKLVKSMFVKGGVGSGKQGHTTAQQQDIVPKEDWDAFMKKNPDAKVTAKTNNSGSKIIYVNGQTAYNAGQGGLTKNADKITAMTRAYNASKIDKK